ncbi:MAG: VWA domain-containing protein [Myxococcales bacterium]|nr:VWA domain-containing protein [Myxococcales bacterium]
MHLAPRPRSIAARRTPFVRLAALPPLLSILVAAALLMWTAAFAQAAPPDASAPVIMEAVTEAGTQANLPLRDELIHVEIDGQHANSVVRHIYDNSSGPRLEGRVRFRAGEGTHVHGFAYYNGARKIVGEVFERQLATQIYEDTVHQRRDPGLLVQESDGLFSFRVFPIEPGEQKRVELMFDQWLVRHGETIELRTPITRQNAEIDVVVTDPRGVFEPQSPTHPIQVTRSSAGRIRVRATQSNGQVDAFVLRYRSGAPTMQLGAAVHHDPGEDAFVLLTVAAPSRVEPSQVAVKDVTLVLDRSGSMAGEPLRQAKRAAAQVIGQLDARDRLNVLVFDTVIDAAFAAPVPATPVNRRDAVEFIERTRDGGGTDIAGALRAAFARQTADGSRTRVILFLTDGMSPSTDALEAATADQNDVRVFTLGLGPAIERPLLSRLAALKRGRFTYVDQATALEQRVADLYASIAAPVMVDVSLSAEGGRVVQVYPPTLPDLFVNDEIKIVARVQSGSRLRFALHGRRGGRQVALRQTVVIGERVRRPWVGKEWGQARLDHLLDEIALHGERPELRDEVIALSLAYNRVTPYTAFLAIPAEELSSDAAYTLAQARAQKQALMQRHSDAAALASDGGSLDMMAARSVPVGGASRDFSANVAASESPVDADEAYDAYDATPRASEARSGCASCSVDARRGDAAWLLVVLVTLGRRRRTRR